MASGGGGDARENREGARIESGRTHRVVGGGGSGSEHHGDWAGAVFAEGAETCRAHAGADGSREVNEAFAAQYLAVEKVLGLKREKTNVNGGRLRWGTRWGIGDAAGDYDFE